MPTACKVFSYCRHIPGCWESFSEHCPRHQGPREHRGPRHDSCLSLDSGRPMQWERGPDGHQVEMDDLFAAIAAGQPYNEADYGRRSTMTAILGRMATYSGQVVQVGRGDQVAARPVARKTSLGCTAAI